MSFSERLINDIDDINTKSDLIACCYSYLMSTVKNEITFLGDYIEVNDNGSENNPNFNILSKFAMDIKKFFGQNFIGKLVDETCKNELIDLVTASEESLTPRGNTSLNEATIAFFILKGLDMYFEDCIYETSEPQPLNNYCKDFHIYINCGLSIMDSIIYEKNYANKIRKNEIRSYLKHIIILETSDVPRNYGIPKLITLQKNKTSLKKILNTKKIKIVLIPTLCEKWFEFTLRSGCSFEVEYDIQKLDAIVDRVISLLKYAIECKANIIVFPEYICSEDVHERISKKLLELSAVEPESLRDLLFVVAGSTWTENSNNVSYIYDEGGELLGKVYKYSAYNNIKNGVRYVERLNDPGKEITLIKVPGIGIFQIEICRNVSENEFCMKLTKAFDTQFLLIPAWSSSVNNGFKKQIDAIISSNHKTCAVLSNSCAAFSDCKEFRGQIGIVAAPQKNNTIVEMNSEDIIRDSQQCNNYCENGCIFEVDFDFNGNNEKDVIIKSEFKKLEKGKC